MNHLEQLNHNKATHTSSSSSNSRYDLASYHLALVPCCAPYAVVPGPHVAVSSADTTVPRVTNKQSRSVTQCTPLCELYQLLLTAAANFNAALHNTNFVQSACELLGSCHGT
jgi:hypothetical protein